MKSTKKVKNKISEIFDYVKSKIFKQDIDNLYKRNKKIIEMIENSPQKGRSMVVIGKENFNTNIVKYLIKNKKKVAVDLLDNKTATQLGYKYPDDVRRVVYGDEMEHILNRHGKNSEFVKSGQQVAITENDIVKWIDYADSATHRALGKDKIGQQVLVSGKQINGYYVVVESVRKKNNELALKSMYFEKGDINKSTAFKNTTDLPSKTKKKLGDCQKGYEPNATLDLAFEKSVDGNIIPQDFKQTKLTSQEERKSIKDEVNEAGLKILSNKENKTNNKGINYE